MVKLFKNLHNTIAQNKFVKPNFEVVLSSRRRHALVRTSFQPWIAWKLRILKREYLKKFQTVMQLFFYSTVQA